MNFEVIDVEVELVLKERCKGKLVNNQMLLTVSSKMNDKLDEQIVWLTYLKPSNIITYMEVIHLEGYLILIKIRAPLNFAPLIFAPSNFALL